MVSDLLFYFLLIRLTFLQPSQMVVADLQENITKLNNGVSFMIKHSQKLFRVSKCNTLQHSVNESQAVQLK